MLCSFKAALLGLTKSLAVENASKGITVNAINLGYVSIGMGVNDVPPAYQEKINHRFLQADFVLRKRYYKQWITLLIGIY